MNATEILAAITPIVDAFEQLRIAYHIGGSVASSAYGLVRATIDVDLVAELRQEHVRSLMKLLEADYYIDADAVRDAIRRRSSLTFDNPSQARFGYRDVVTCLQRH